MAEPTEEDLLKQAKKIQDDANKKAKELKEKAKEIKQKNLATLGELTIKFLQNEISLEELKTFATNHNFLKN
ncbi:hypothetical protein N5T96_01610 [Aliarcobacter butzleri]|uniref:hypothetical protein n=1 Tax=Aliarcobacter butzleri TaxID=28197 RepID=UPI0006581F7E|nr:hypothetical protein [Aliarcobacter butzleri]KLE06512.1 hypothetical protein AF78_03030 [Aliarcobacter butzleri L353]MCG3705806.1 hypothetical protein [Aliarcobacter butzleri]MCT7565026.1 hypothetical protein [Aliarcobacter butzleri]MDN5072362.1 hypothetical protein [Aliarcobacter butzleri]MDN5087089.1 hypothetical protein [Aliarcobacter butzleri]